MKIDITCKKAVDYISKKEEHRLSSWQRFQLWRHLSVCSLCKRFSNQNKFIRKTFEKRNLLIHTLSEAEKNHIVENVLKQTD